MSRTRKNRASVRAFLNYNGFDKIVEFCNLKSKDHWNDWFDEDGNKLKIGKNKAIYIYPSNNKPLKTNNILKKSLPGHIANNSTWCLALFGKYKKIICFLGTDNILRCSLFENNIWIENIEPLLLGFKCLEKIEKNLIEEKIILNIDCCFFKVETCFCVLLPTEDKRIKKLCYQDC